MDKIDLKTLNINPRAINNAFYRVMLDLATDLNDPTMLGWRDLESQTSRYDVFLENCFKNGQSVLDFGCGLGDFYQYTKDKGYSINYKGIDIIEDFVKKSKEKYGNEINVTTGNVLFDMTNYDWVFANGTFSVGFTENTMYEYIEHLLSISKIGVCFNLLDSNVFENDVQMSFYPDETYDFIKNKYNDKEVKLVTGYTDDDFTIIIKHK